MSVADQFLETKGIIIRETIGDGTYSKVKKAFDRERNCNIAVKIINRNEARGEYVYLEHFLPRELRIVRQVEHRNIIKTHEIVKKDHRIFLLMELASCGDLEQHINVTGPFREIDRRDYAHMIFRQLLDAIAYLHHQNIVHRDAKCDNILLDAYWNAKLADFGFARETSPENLCSTNCGSAAYAAPEILKDDSYIAAPTDMWSLGVVLFIMLSGRMPFDDSDLPAMLRRQLEENVTFPPELPSEEARQLIRALLQPNVQKRLTADDAINSDWLRHTPYFNRPNNPEPIPNLNPNLNPNPNPNLNPNPN